MPRGRPRKNKIITQEETTNNKTEKDINIDPTSNIYNILFNIRGSINLKLSKGKRPNVAFRNLTIGELETIIMDDPTAQVDWELSTNKQDKKNKIIVEGK